MSETLSVIAIFVPLFAIMGLANAAQARRDREEPYQGFVIMAYVLLVALYGAGILVGLSLQLLSAVATTAPEVLEGMQQAFTFDSVWLLALGFWLPSLVGLILLLRPVRRLFVPYTHIDLDSPVHTVALSFSMLVVINLMMTLGVGLGNLADVLAATEQSGTTTLISLWVQQILTALLAMVGVGWLTRRSLRATLDRLGLVWPTPRQWAIGLGAGVAMVPVVLGLEYLASLTGLGASPDVERLTQELLGALFTSPIGILTLGLSAALGEETLFRGALTPRFGILLSSVLFALVHSNYGITLSTLVVLILGILLAFLRMRYNTTTAMATHAIYNISLGVLAYLSTLNLGV
jgi:membrane protease YdiL (CAAX protease family)